MLPPARVLVDVRTKAALLDLGRSAGFLQLLLDRLRLLFGDAFLDRRGSALDQVLGLLEAETGDFPHRLDDIDLLLAERGQDDGELRLLLDRSGLAATCRRSSR